MSIVFSFNGRLKPYPTVALYKLKGAIHGNHNTTSLLLRHRRRQNWLRKLRYATVTVSN